MLAAPCWKSGALIRQLIRPVRYRAAAKSSIHEGQGAAMGEQIDVPALAAEFDLHDEEAMQSPYSAYDRFRAACPIAKSNQHGGYSFATSYDAVKESYSNFRAFSST